MAVWLFYLLVWIGQVGEMANRDLLVKACRIIGGRIQRIHLLTIKNVHDIVCLALADLKRAGKAEEFNIGEGLR